MPSHFARTYQHMAFTPDKDVFVRHAVLSYAEKTLAAFLQGQERAYAVRDVLEELRETFPGGAAYAVQMIEQALQTDDETTRLQLVTRALDLIGRQARPPSPASSR